MYNKKSYVKARCCWIQCIQIIKTSKKNLESNCQTHSGVARKKLIKNTKMRLFSKTGNGQRHLLFSQKASPQSFD